MSLQCIVVTPERTVLQEPADFVAVTLDDGEIGIAPRHTPLIGRLGFGEMRISRANQTSRFYIESGFVEVHDDVVTVLTGRAIPAAEIDEAAVLEQIQTVETKLARSPETADARDKAVRQGRAQLRVARRTL